MAKVTKGRFPLTVDSSGIDSPEHKRKVAERKRQRQAARAAGRAKSAGIKKAMGSAARKTPAGRVAGIVGMMAAAGAGAVARNTVRDRAAKRRNQTQTKVRRSGRIKYQGDR